MSRNINIGDRIRLLEDVDMNKILYKKGHEFTVVSSSFRGLDLEDDDGNRLDETLFIHSLLELIEK